ncbi:MAG: ABC transporter permease subunit [Bryobacterales bacterium]|nr:ABC transporter permease subunit [Bryobacterales bacterium]
MRPALRPIVTLAPLAIVLLGLFGGGLLLGLLQSVGLFALTGSDAFTLSHYRALLNDREFLVSLALSVWVASLATAVSLLLGVTMATALHYGSFVGASRTRWQRTLLQVPLAMPHLSLALVVLHLLSPSGMLSRVAYALGLAPEPSAFPVLVQDAASVGILLAYVWKEAPFLAVVALTMLTRVSRDFDDAARTLGATRWQMWRRVHLPLVAPGLVSASLAVFAYVFGAYEVPLLLGRTYPAMLGVLAERRFSSVDLIDRPAALALALAMSLIAAMLVWVYLRLARQLVGERPVLF